MELIKICHQGRRTPWSLGIRLIPPPNDGNPYNGYIKPYYWVDEFIPYYMEIMGVWKTRHLGDFGRLGLGGPPCITGAYKPGSYKFDEFTPDP